ncbi:TetR family transcriptional regulator [Pseudohalocynthiibacter aestuariivivens]|nr:TetR/AcrR family transcriptional regulator [Pseudohalocynthiibacter aestuariivivens]QIE44598.1 TetR family transcriptional regulator [Pseudohalocynthiibacter aestuariivivens]
MPRPSLKDQRSEEILDAFLTCVARFGLEGATQERIAEQAGVKRTLLRHYLGNRDEMISALTDHVVAEFAKATDLLAQTLNPDGGLRQLIDLLFDQREASDPRLMLAYQAMVASAENYPDMRSPLLDSLQSFLTVIEAAAKRSHPTSPPGKIRAVVHGISAGYVNLDALSPLKPPADWHTAAKTAAILLADSLDDIK